MSRTAQENSFGAIRSFFWPIHRNELKRFIPMSLMMFFILFNYTSLRNSKDALVISAGGASVLPFLKGYVVFPVSLLFVIIYSKMVNIYSRERVFYTITSFFLGFYALFALLIYPNRELLHPSPELINTLNQAVPALRQFFAIFATWSFSIYYVLAELWGSAVLSLLFWQLANDITRTSEAKRFYSMFNLISNFALILVGVCGTLFAYISKSMAHANPYFYTNYMVCGSIVLSGLMILYLYRWLNFNALGNSPEIVVEPPKKKKKLSAAESFRFLASNKYLLMIALLVLCYGVSINLAETVWKNQINKAFPEPNDYQAFVSSQTILMGLFTMGSVLMAKEITRIFGWFWGAIMTPLMLLITGGLFFYSVLNSDVISPIAAGLGISTLMFGVWAGTIQNVLSKSIKYGLFDPTKEMAYIPLDKESKTKGKAAVDVLGARLGKASGGYISSVLIMLTSSASDVIADKAAGVNRIAPFLAGFFVVAILVWIYAVVTLSGMYRAKVAEKEGITNS